MDLLITAATANRKLSKMVVRTSHQTAQLQALCRDVGSNGEAFDLIIVTLVDEPSDSYVEIPNNDNVYHVEVGYSPDLTFAPGTDPCFFHEVAARMHTVLKRAPLNLATRKGLLNAVANWESQFHEASHE